MPGAKSARDILEHFDEYARGEGKLVEQAMRDLSIDMYEAAAMYWGGYDPAPRRSRKAHSSSAFRRRWRPLDGCNVRSRLPAKP